MSVRTRILAGFLVAAVFMAAVGVFGLVQLHGAQARIRDASSRRFEPMAHLDNLRTSSDLAIIYGLAIGITVFTHQGDVNSSLTGIKQSGNQVMAELTWLRDAKVSPKLHAQLAALPAMWNSFAQSLMTARGPG